MFLVPTTQKLAPHQTTIIAEHREKPYAIAVIEGRIVERQKSTLPVYPWAEHVKIEAA